MLVTERSWGPVSTAMSTEPFSSLTALHIAQQIASALSYLSMRRIQHGAVAMGNVWLLKKPSRSRWNMSVNWAANKRFEISKFKFEFPRARTYEMIGLVLGGTEAKFCKYILVGMSYLFEKENSRRDLHNALLCTVL